MLSRRSAVLLALSLSAALVGCLGSGSTQSNKVSPTITSISISPQNSAVTIGKKLQFFAQATYSDGSTKDITSTTAWQTSDSNVATVSAGAVVGVKAGVITVRAGSGSVTATSLLNVTNKEFSNANLNGAYVLTLVTGVGAPSLQLEAGSISADGNGNFKGEEDVNGPSGSVTALSLSGTYSITADGRGELTLNSAGQAGRKFRFVLYSKPSGGNDGALIEFDGTHNAVGKIEEQDQAAFANSALANAKYVFRGGGLDSSQKNISLVGVFATDSTGAVVSSGEEDVNDNGMINNGAGSTTPISITNGTIDAIDPSSGRATMSLTANGGRSDFALYVVSASKIEMLGLDTTPSQATAEKQTSPAPSSVGAGSYVFLTDMGGVTGQFWMTGQMGIDNTSHFSNGVAFQDGGVNLTFVTPAATFAVASGGRGTFQQNTNRGTFSGIAYLVSGSEMYLLQTADAHAASGVAQLQSPGPDGFTSASLNNTFVISAAEIGDGNVSFIAQIVSDGLGHIVGIEDVSQPQAGNPSQLAVSTVGFNAGSSTPNAAGGFSFNVSSSRTGVTSLAALLISSSSAVLVGQPNDVDGMLIVQ